jgi:hypothetical protein
MAAMAVFKRLLSPFSLSLTLGEGGEEPTVEAIIKAVLRSVVLDSSVTITSVKQRHNSILQQHAANETLGSVGEDTEPAVVPEGLSAGGESDALTIGGYMEALEEEQRANAAFFMEEGEAKKEAEEQAKKEAEEQAKKGAEEQAKKEAEEGEAKKEAEEQAKKEAEEQAKKEAEEQALKEAEEQALKEAEEQALKEAEEQALKEEQEQEKKEEEERARKEAEETELEAEIRAAVSIAAVERARQEAEEQLVSQMDWHPYCSQWLSDGAMHNI